MSRKETIEDKIKSLEAKEQKIKVQLDSNSDELKEKAMRVGKIALITGVVAILGYWIFNVIFQDDEEEKPKKRKKRNRESKGFSERIVALAMPYLNKALDGILEGDNEDGKKGSKKETSPEED